MRHGIGSEAQQSVLLAAGVERLWLPRELSRVLAMKDIAPLAWRPEDVIVMVQPKMITAELMRSIARYAPMFEVLGHAPVDCGDQSGIQKLRGLMPMVEAVVEPRKGGNVRYAQPTPAQLHVIVGYWHGSMKPREFMPLVREMMGEPELPNTAVRDWVIKATGNSKRDPNAPGKRPLPAIDAD